jgi:hypothetical protein
MKTYIPILTLLFLFSIHFCQAQNDTIKQEEPLSNSNYNRGAGTNPNNYSSGNSTKNNAGNDSGQPRKKKQKKNTNSSPANAQKRRK